MRLTMTKKALIAALEPVVAVIAAKNDVPILGHVRIDAAASHATFAGTDLDRKVEATAVATVETPGAICAPGRLLHNIARQMPDGGEVALALDGNALTVACGRARFRLPVLPIADFPDIEGAVADGARFGLSAAGMAAAFARPAFAVSTEEARYYLNGIYLHRDGDRLRAVATDGHRLARLEIEASAGGEDMPGVIVPRAACAWLAARKAACTLTVGATKIAADFDGLRFVAKLIDGTYPDYNRVIPTGNDRILSIDKGALAAAVERVSAVSAERRRAVKLAAAENLLTVTCSDPDDGTATDEVPCQWSSPPLEIGVNARYLLDNLAALKGAEAEFAMAAAGTFILIRDPAYGTALYVLVPMRV